MIQITPGALQISPSTTDFIINYTPIVVEEGGTSPVEITVRDSVYTRVVTAIKTVHGQITLEGNAENFVEYYSSTNPVVASVDATGRITTHASGGVIIVVGILPAKRTTVHNGSITGGETVDTFSRYIDGTLGKEINDTTISMAAPGKSKSVYSTISHDLAIYSRNANCWVSRDLTAWPIRNSTTGQRFNGCAVSKRHLVVANHAYPSIGSVVLFVALNNQVVERTIIASQFIGIGDLRIALLDSDLPASISPCKVLPENWREYISFAGLEIICGDQDAQVLAHTVLSAAPHVTIIHTASTRAELAPYAEPIVGGDSGSPIWCVLGSELLLLGVHAGATSFAMIADLISEIDAAMSTLGGGYQLTEVDLSSYPSFP